jgi:hypothetical protein
MTLFFVEESDAIKYVGVIGELLFFLKGILEIRFNAKYSTEKSCEIFFEECETDVNTM